MGTLAREVISFCRPSQRRSTLKGLNLLKANTLGVDPNFEAPGFQMKQTEKSKKEKATLVVFLVKMLNTFRRI